MAERTYALGAKHRAFDIRELPYRLTAPTVVDLTVARTLAPWRTRVEDQGNMGSCVANATTSAAEMLARIRGLMPEQLDRLWLYYECRVKEGTFPDDAGSYPADACDRARAGLPPESAEPNGYIADATFRPPASVDAAATIDYVSGHQPFYATDPQGFVGGICNALDQQMPVLVALGWRNEFFSPPGGILPALPNAQIVGGHCIVAWGYTPDMGGLVWCRNSWGEGWTAAAVNAMQALNGYAEPGDFAIPAALFSNGIVWECRAVSGVAVTPQPTPTPTPTPDHSDYTLAESIVGGVRDNLKAQWDAHHKAAAAHYRYLGAEDAVQALIAGRPV